MFQVGLCNFRVQLLEQYDTIKSYQETMILKKEEADNQPTTPSSRKSKNLIDIEDLKVASNVNGLEDVAGLKDVKKDLIASIILPLHQSHLFQKFQICKSILLYGPPGTGKTLLAHALAAEIKADLYAISASSIISSYIGESEQYYSD